MRGITELVELWKSLTNSVIAKKCLEIRQTSLRVPPHVGAKYKAENEQLIKTSFKLHCS